MSEELSLAEKLFDGNRAESDLYAKLNAAGVKYEDLGWDWYDNSLEIKGVPPEFRLPRDAQKVVHKAGFSKAFVNHTDKWETHYSFKPQEGFSESKGWRVSYPYKRGEGESSIWVESVPASWPAEWTATGYVIVKTPSSSGPTP